MAGTSVNPYWVNGYPLPILGQRYLLTSCHFSLHFPVLTGLGIGHSTCPIRGWIISQRSTDATVGSDPHRAMAMNQTLKAMRLATNIGWNLDSTGIGCATERPQVPFKQRRLLRQPPHSLAECSAEGRESPVPTTRRRLQDGSPMARPSPGLLFSPCEVR